MTDLHIGGWYTDGAAKLTPPNHPAFHGIGVTEQGLGASQIPRRQCGTYLRTGDAFAVQTLRIERRHAKAIARTKRLQQCEIASTARSETEIVTDHHMFGAHGADQHLAHEIFRTQSCKRLVKTTDPR